MFALFLMLSMEHLGDYNNNPDPMNSPFDPSAPMP
jgi:hypothetical protein